MTIRVTDIGQLDGKAWLVVEEGETRFSMKLDAPQLATLANSIIFVLRHSAREKREFARSLENAMQEAV